MWGVCSGLCPRVCLGLSYPFQRMPDCGWAIANFGWQTYLQEPWQLCTSKINSTAFDLLWSFGGAGGLSGSAWVVLEAFLELSVDFLEANGKLCSQHWVLILSSGAQATLLELWQRRARNTLSGESVQKSAEERNPGFIVDCWNPTENIHLGFGIVRQVYGEFPFTGGLWLTLTISKMRLTLLADVIRKSKYDK